MTDVSRRRDLLRDGIAALDGVQLRDEMGLGPDALDLDVARAIVKAVGATSDLVALDPARRQDPRPVTGPMPVQAADSSFLGRLDGKDGAVADIEDLRTVVAVARGGRLRQRRAAVLRLADLVTEDRKGISSELQREGTETLLAIRDVEIAYELSDARSRLPGSVGREVRHDRGLFHRLAQTVGHRVAAFWDGELPEEPIAALPGDQRALLLMRVRDLPEAIVDHLGVVIEGGSGVTERNVRLALLSSLRYAGDPRLVAPMRALLGGSDRELSGEAARVLGRVDDPRAHPALLAVYERAVGQRARVVLAGALAQAGDLRGTACLREALEGDDVDLQRHALDALSATGSGEHCEVVVEILREGDPSLRVQAVRTLARVGDGRALASLGELRDRTDVSSLRAEIEDAEAAIVARLELCGEEVDTTGMFVLPKRDKLTDAGPLAPRWVRMRARTDYVVGRMWLAIGAVRRAVNRFDRAAQRRSNWAAPLVAIAMIYAGRDRFSKALSNFRRAVEADRTRVERTPSVVGAMTRAFLRRAEQVERDGRVDVARGLLEEVMSLDLRRAPPSLRFEVSRRYESMRRRRGEP